MLGAARPQLCMCSPLILSICVWDREGTPVLYLTPSPSVALYLPPHPPSIIRAKAEIKMSSVLGETCKSAKAEIEFLNMVSTHGAAHVN